MRRPTVRAVAVLTVIAAVLAVPTVAGAMGHPKLIGTVGKNDAFQDQPHVERQGRKDAESRHVHTRHPRRLLDPQLRARRAPRQVVDVHVGELRRDEDGHAQARGGQVQGVLRPARVVDVPALHRALTRRCYTTGMRARPALVALVVLALAGCGHAPPDAADGPAGNGHAHGDDDGDRHPDGDDDPHAGGGPRAAARTRSRACACATARRRCRRGRGQVRSDRRSGARAHAARPPRRLPRDRVQRLLATAASGTAASRARCAAAGSTGGRRRVDHADRRRRAVRRRDAGDRRGAGGLRRVRGLGAAPRAAGRARRRRERAEHQPLLAAAVRRSRRPTRRPARTSACSHGATTRSRTSRRRWR